LRDGRWLSALPAAVFEALPALPLRSTLLAARAARALVTLPFAMLVHHPSGLELYRIAM